MGETQVSKKLAAMKSELRAEGKAMRRKLVGDAYADKLDKEVYTNHHMEKFGALSQELIFAQMWGRPGLDLKTRSLITVISDTTAGASAALSLHVRFCRIHGWSEDEIVESILHLMGYIGIPLVRQALLVATKVFDEMNAEGGNAGSTVTNVDVM